MTDPTNGAPAFVVVSPGTAAERRVPVPGRIFIGRQCAGIEPDARILIDDFSISRTHLEIRLDADRNMAFVIDTSTNGTYLNGSRLGRALPTQIKSGEVHPYAVTTTTRIDVLPDLPTVAESGIEGFELSAWHALWAPKDTPEAIRNTLAEALQAALKDPLVIERFASLGTAPVSADLATPAALDARFKSEVDRLTKLIEGSSK